VRTTVCERELESGHRIQVTWAGHQTALPTGALDASAARRTRYFFEVMIDEIYYYANRFLTSPDPEDLTDDAGNPILSRADILLELCADRVARTVEAGHLDFFPNDLGTLDLAELRARAGGADPA
jgi:hypothetical protein